ncbi:hypothetical protein D3C78_1700810 [compost metagenome]
MNTNELLEFINSGDTSAEDLLDGLNPKLKKKLKKIRSDLNEVITEVRSSYPDANYYVSDRSIHLMLGDSHDGIADNADLSALSLDVEHLDGGGW